MGEFTDVKRKKISKLLIWLQNNKGVILTTGGNHQISVNHKSWNRPHPIPFKKNKVNKHIVKDLMKRLVASNICTEEEFRDKL